MTSNGILDTLKQYTDHVQCHADTQLSLDPLHHIVCAQPFTCSETTAYCGYVMRRTSSFDMRHLRQICRSAEQQPDLLDVAC